ncbi:hypothetical protein GGR56DRAFT_436070 [Xylariaceae sp. FL0804]|nr:hypothetical protein GGR56DRAFT_436070 [Xylariaceae sp. FL0804]
MMSDCGRRAGSAAAVTVACRLGTLVANAVYNSPAAMCRSSTETLPECCRAEQARTGQVGGSSSRLSDRQAQQRLCRRRPRAESLAKAVRHRSTAPSVIPFRASAGGEAQVRETGAGSKTDRQTDRERVKDPRRAGRRKAPPCCGWGFLLVKSLPRSCTLTSIAIPTVYLAAYCIGSPRPACCRSGCSPTSYHPELGADGTPIPANLPALGRRGQERSIFFSLPGLFLMRKGAVLELCAACHPACLQRHLAEGRSRRQRTPYPPR